MLLHGHFQPLQRLQPQLRAFFHQHYLGGQEPTPGNIRVSEGPGPRGWPPSRLLSLTLTQVLRLLVKAGL